MSSVVTLDISKLLARVAKTSAELAPANILRLIGMRLQSFVDESFRTQGRGAWKPHAALTVKLMGAHPLRQVTGEDRRSYTVKSDNSTYVEIGSELKKSEWMEFGTKPYSIHAKNGTLIAKARDGQWIPFGKSVNHPGIPARPALPTLRQGEELAREVAEALVRKATSG